jgi:hypothetical protein
LGEQALSLTIRALSIVIVKSIEASTGKERFRPWSASERREKMGRTWSQWINNALEVKKA